MPNILPRVLVTGATGQLGRLVVDGLLQNSNVTVAALVRDKAAGERLRGRGVEVHEGDYTRGETLDAALKGIDRLLLISSSELGQRVTQHRNVIDAAKRAGVKLLAYTSVLHADTSPLGLAEDHRQTEAALRESGLSAVVLRNGWYTENYAAGIPTALAHGAVVGSAGEGRIASAARADYAAAAVAVLTASDGQGGRVYELAGDESYTLTRFAAEIARLSGKSVVYRDLPEADYKAMLLGAGLPDGLASLLADSDAGAAKGALDDTGRQLSTLIGRPTMPFASTIAEALAF